MPTKPGTPCAYPNCPEITTSRFCDKHAKANQKDADVRRGTAHQRGYNKKWSNKVRRNKLNLNPLCEKCAKRGLVVAADLVHHIDRNPRHNAKSNLMSLCRSCHDEEHVADRFSKLR